MSKRYTPHCPDCGSRMTVYRASDGDKLYRCTNELCHVYTDCPQYDVEVGF